MRPDREPAAARLAPDRVDRLLAGVVAVVCLQEVWLPVPGASFTSGPPWLLSMAYLVAAASLLWRRRAPLAVVVLITCVLSATSIAFGASDGLAPLLPVVAAGYALGRYGSAAELWPGIGVLVLGIAVHELRDPRPFFTGPTPIVSVLMPASALLGRFVAVKDRRIKEAAARTQEAELAREQAATRAAADERGRMTRELHDLVGHGLSLLVVQAGAAQATLDAGDSAGARRRLDQVEATARATMAELRTLLALEDGGQQDDGRAPQPGLDDIGALVASVRGAGVEVDYEADGAGHAVPAGVALAAYRVVQESLTNVVKHAGPGASARVEVAVDGDALTVDVIDAGRGADPMTVPGRGIAGMRERVALHGGTFWAGGRADGGFEVRARLPMRGSRA